MLKTCDANVILSPERVNGKRDAKPIYMRASPVHVNPTQFGMQNAHVPICLCNGIYDYMGKEMKKEIHLATKRFFSSKAMRFKWMMRTLSKSDLMASCWMYDVYVINYVSRHKENNFHVAKLDSLHMSLSLSSVLIIYPTEMDVTWQNRICQIGFYRSNYAAWCRRRTSSQPALHRMNTQPSNNSRRTTWLQKRRPHWRNAV